MQQDTMDFDVLNSDNEYYVYCGETIDNNMCSLQITGLNYDTTFINPRYIKRTRILGLLPIPQAQFIKHYQHKLDPTKWNNCESQWVYIDYVSSNIISTDITMISYFSGIVAYHINNRWRVVWFHTPLFLPHSCNVFSVMGTPPQITAARWYSKDTPKCTTRNIERRNTKALYTKTSRTTRSTPKVGISTYNHNTAKLMANH